MSAITTTPTIDEDGNEVAHSRTTLNDVLSTEENGISSIKVKDVNHTLFDSSARSEINNLNKYVVELSSDVESINTEIGNPNDEASSSTIWGNINKVQNRVDADESSSIFKYIGETNSIPEVYSNITYSALDSFIGNIEAETMFKIYIDKPSPMYEYYYINDSGNITFSSNSSYAKIPDYSIVLAVTSGFDTIVNTSDETINDSVNKGHYYLMKSERPVAFYDIGTEIPSNDFLWFNNIGRGNTIEIGDVIKIEDDDNSFTYYVFDGLEFTAINKKAATTSNDGYMTSTQVSALDKATEDISILKSGLSSAFKYIGSIENVPSASNSVYYRIGTGDYNLMFYPNNTDYLYDDYILLEVGNIINVKNTADGTLDGMNYVWNGNFWDALGMSLAAASITSNGYMTSDQVSALNDATTAYKANYDSDNESLELTPVHVS